MLITVAPARRLPAALVEAAHTHAAFAFSCFSRHIRSVTIRVVDASAPREGVDQECTVAISMVRPGADIFVADVDADPFAALARATKRAARTVVGRLGRRHSWRDVSDRELTVSAGKSPRRKRKLTALREDEP